MSDLKVVQFVIFETELDRGPFINRWEEYDKSADSGNVTLQQSEGENIFKYLAQHTCLEGGLRFFFSKVSHSSRVRRTIISVKQAGGYIMLHSERTSETKTDERKVFAFFTSTGIDLNACRQIALPLKLNIYEAYYENCSYSYILEFFIKNKYVSELLTQLKKVHPSEINIYKEFAMSTV